jgi:hypothetical protein
METSLPVPLEHPAVAVADWPSLVLPVPQILSLLVTLTFVIGGSMRSGRVQSTSILARAALAGLLSLAWSPSFAVAQNLTGAYGNWIVMADDTMSLALTTDDQETAFGLVCGPECYFYIESRTSCTEGRDYIVEIAAGTGGYRAVMTCKPADKTLLLMMPQDERFLKLIAKQDLVSFAISRDDGETGRLRFSLAGSEQAVGLALAARAYIKTPGPPELTPIAETVK